MNNNFNGNIPKDTEEILKNNGIDPKTVSSGDAKGTKSQAENGALVSLGISQDERNQTVVFRINFTSSNLLILKIYRTRRNKPSKTWFLSC